MAGIWLFWMLVGSTASHLLIVPESSIYLSTGNTALLSASLNFSASVVPEYFQLRWRFDSNSCLMLMLKADTCRAESGTRRWRDSCRIKIVKTERYRHRAEMLHENASLVLQNVSAEDSGIYSITMLASDLMLSANIILTVTDVPTGYTLHPVIAAQSRTYQQVMSKEVPVSFVMAASVRDYKMINIIQLSLAGVILCLLVLIIAKHISFTHCKESWTVAKNEEETIQVYQDGSESTFPSLPGNTFLLLEMSSSEDFDGLYYNSRY